MLKSIAVAFSTYSSIPMPQFTWTEKNMRFSMCFFPLIGAVIGGLMLLADYVCSAMSVTPIFRAALLTALPVLITGGIHMDGFLDTIDARRSFKGKEERLRILKDPHTGAFAVIYTGVLLLMSFGLSAETGSRQVLLACALSFVTARCLSGISVVSFPKARQDGSLKMMADASHKRVRFVLILELLFTAAAELAAAPWSGGAAIFTQGILFYYYRRMAERDFGGTTGDLAGWFVTMAEFAALCAAVLAGRLLPLIKGLQ